MHLSQTQWGPQSTLCVHSCLIAMRTQVLLAVALRTSSSLRVSRRRFRHRRASYRCSACATCSGQRRCARIARQGMSAFEKGEVEESIKLFDAAEEADPRYATRLWQRGLSYYYADRFKDAKAIPDGRRREPERHRGGRLALVGDGAHRGTGMRGRR